MGVLVPAVRVKAALAVVRPDLVVALIDHMIEDSESIAISEGREEVALDKAGGKNVYYVSWVDVPHGVFRTTERIGKICFFGHDEQEVIDRIGVAEVMGA